MSGPLSWIAHRFTAGAIERHFQHRLSARSERRMRAHLAACGSCRLLYECQLLLEGEGPAAARARRARFEAALFPSRESAELARGRSLRLALGLASATAALLLAVLWLRPPEFREKGLASGAFEASRRVSIAVYARTGSRLVPVRGELASGQPLAFAYSNLAPEGFDRLLLFAVDETYTVYWFYPAWTDPRTIPSGGYPIERARDRELPDQVAHRYQGERLQLVALFTSRRDLGVREVEAQVQELARRGVSLQELQHFPLAETGQHILSLRVRRR